MKPESFFRRKFDVNEESERLECFRTFDLQNKGHLDADDILLFAKSLLDETNGANMAADIFAEFDRNSDGRIDRSEFETCWRELVEPLLKPVSALIVVDVQNDFVTGSLAMLKCSARQDGAEVIPVINALIRETPFDAVVYSMDCHPDDHISFYDNIGLYQLDEGYDKERIAMFDDVVFRAESSSVIHQRLWPKHCVRDTPGARLHADLHLADDPIIIRKGTDPRVDSYSAFFDNSRLSKTELDDELKRRGVTRVFACGLALDYCVGFTVLDSLGLGYPTVLVRDATRGTAEEEMAQMEDRIRPKGGVVASSSEVSALAEGTDVRPEFARVLLSRAKMRRESEPV